MELRIISPREGGAVREIQWNREEVLHWASAIAADRKGLVFTEDTIKDAKKDRADLNKLKTAMENERKRIKKECMEPYEKFEREVKEAIAIIEEPIRLIDVQIKEVEENKKIQKRQEIEELFQTIGFQSFVTLDMIFDSKWLNATTSINKIEEQMTSQMYKIGEEVYTITQLPEFSFEAMEHYKKTLDIAGAIKEGQRLSDIQKRKAVYEEQRRKQEEERAAAELQRVRAEEMVAVEPAQKTKSVEAKTSAEPEIKHLDFRVWGTREQLMELRDYMKNHDLRFGKVE